MVEIYIGSGIIALIFFIFQMMVLATAIDIGEAAIPRGYTSAQNYTYVLKGNSANETGTITSIEIYALISMTDCEVGIFYVVSGDNLSTRSTVTIGNVTGGSKQTFTEDSGSDPISMEVQTGDYIGIVFGGGGTIYRDYSAGGGIWWISGDYIPCTNEAFTLTASHAMSLYGTGTTEVPPAVKKKNVIFMGSNF